MTAEVAGRLARTAALVDALLGEATPGHGELSPDEQLRRQRQARDLLDGGDVAAAVFSAASLVPEHVNARWRGLFGTDAGEVEGGGLPAELRVHLAEAMREHRRVDLPEAELHEPTRLQVCALAITPRPGAAGAIVACIDVTDTAVARRFEVPQGARCWVGDAAGATRYTSAEWRHYTGLRAATSWLESIHVEDRERCTRACGEVARGQGPRAVDARLCRGDGAYRWHAVRFTSAAPSVVAVAVELAEAREPAGQFLAMVSHELRAPLTTMLLWERVLRHDAVDAEQRLQALDAIRESALLQSRLVGDLLDLARATSGKLHIDLRAVDVGNLLEQALARVAPGVAAKQITLETRLARELHPIDGDAVRISQIFDNLLSNAVKFTPVGGRVTVSAARGARGLVIEIADSGCGISKEFLPRLFEPFSQSNASLARAEGGLGLGLAIARDLAVLHGGSLEAASPGVGHGTTMTLTLPAATRVRTATPTPGSPTLPLDRVRMLVVDDDQRVRDALALLLGRVGATVVVAASAAAARELLVDQPFDVILCDIAMPGEDGYALLRWIRTRGLATPAIALTAYATASDAKSARAAGFVIHLAKPVDFDRLVTSVHAAIASI